MVVDPDEERLQFNAGEAIGDYGCTMDKTSRFIYKTTTVCEGFFIRKRFWVQVLNSNAFIAKGFKHNIVKRYKRQ